MLEKVIEAGDRALIFTQFDEMGILLHHHLEESFGRDVLWLADKFSMPSATAWWIAFSPPAAITLVSSSSLSRPVGPG